MQQVPTALGARSPSMLRASLLLPRTSFFDIFPASTGPYFTQDFFIFNFPTPPPFCSWRLETVSVLTSPSTSSLFYADLKLGTLNSCLRSPPPSAATRGMRTTHMAFPAKPSASLGHCLSLGQEDMAAEHSLALCICPSQTF